MIQTSRYECPVCGGTMMEDVSHADYIMTEADEWCCDCNYMYSFSHGSTVERIGDEELHGYYTDKPSERLARQEQRVAAIARRREQLFGVPTVGRFGYEDFDEA